MIINVWRWIGAIGIMAVGVVLAALVWRYCSWGDFDACDEVGLLMVWLMVVLIAALNYGMG